MKIKHQELSDDLSEDLSDQDVGNDFMVNSFDPDYHNMGTEAVSDELHKIQEEQPKEVGAVDCEPSLLKTDVYPLRSLDPILMEAALHFPDSSRIEDEQRRVANDGRDCLPVEDDLDRVAIGDMELFGGPISGSLDSLPNLLGLQALQDEEGGPSLDHQVICEEEIESPRSILEMVTTAEITTPLASGQKWGRGQPKGSKNRKPRSDVFGVNLAKHFNIKDPVPLKEQEAGMAVEEAKATLEMADLLGLVMDDCEQCLQHFLDLRRS